jgi:hypothetical protein
MTPRGGGGETTAGFECSGFVSHVLTSLFPNAPFSGDVSGYVSSPRFVDVADGERKIRRLVNLSATAVQRGLRTPERMWA